MQIYSEKLIAVAEDAFVGQDMSNDCIYTLLIGFFADGLQHNSLKYKPLRENPGHCNRNSTERREHNNEVPDTHRKREHQRFSTSDKGEPMEVN